MALPTPTSSVASKINSEIIQPIIVLLFAVAIGYFLFGLMVFIKNPDNEESHEAGKKHMIWGVVGMAIMFGVYGLLNLINETVGGIT